ncbi:MAG: hypothetical protein BWY23_01254 [Spirochaetes bacterium ADurb.Bin218]|jgi:hypothetical protein|nr:MAG: hypothetical protein BWY23_01254 [Spirochaetes bacterium ADurb.Bin218]HOQ12521.1 hypothetical protein [Spirochaetota bacterium]
MKLKFLAIALLMIALLNYSADAALVVDATFTNPDLQSALGGTAGPVATTVYNELSKYAYVPELVKGFGNANIYTSHAATLRGYQGYDLFAVAIGTMVSVQAPSDDPQFYKKLQDDIDSGDVYAGVGFEPVVFQAGLNMSFLIDGLYVSFLFGKLHIDLDYGDFKLNHESSLIGGNINYALFKEKSILARSLLWRGITLQTGYIHTDNSLVFYNKLDKSTYSQSVSGFTVQYEIDPSVDFNLSTTSNVIPFEIYTGLRLLWVLNIGVGAGIDYVYSSSNSMKLSSAGDVEVIDDGVGGISGYVGEKGKITVDASTSGIKADKYKKKLMANVGLGLGPVFIDVPVSYYFDNGYAIGLTAGFVW